MAIKTTQRNYLGKWRPIEFENIFFSSENAISLKIDGFLQREKIKLLVTNRVDEIGFSGTRKQPKN